MFYTFYSDDYDFDNLNNYEIQKYKKNLYKYWANCEKTEYKFIIHKIAMLNKYLLKKIYK